MKKNILIIAAAAFAFSACGLLDKDPQSKLSPETFFKNATDLQLFTNPYYNNLLPKSIFSEQSDQYVHQDPSNLVKSGSNRTVPASGGTISLSFQLYSPSTEITADPWITIQEEDRVLEAGEHTVQVNCTANGTGLPRNGQIRLRTQAGITTNIDITQKN